jgi:hypothetical protein
MRYWSGAEVNYATDANPAVIVTGAADTRVTVPNDIWRLEKERGDGAKIWRLAKSGVLARTEKPVAPKLADVLVAKLASIKPSGLHPAWQNSLEGEAKRLYPEITPEAVADVSTFIDFLKAEFGLEKKVWQSDSLMPFVDDFGPDMLAYIDDKPQVLPEVPPVYEAPETWRQTQWWVSNHLFGPALIDEVPLEKKIIFKGLPTSVKTNDPHIEGLVYFHALRASIAGDAWRMTREAPLTRGLIQLIMESGLRPWRVRVA